VSMRYRAFLRFFRRWVPLLYLLPLVYLLRPVFWTPIDLRFYNLFHSKRQVPPWTEVIVVGLDEATRTEVLSSPVFPLSRHTETHAALTRRLSAAGAKAIIFDLHFGEELLEDSPDGLAEAFRSAGNVYLVTSMIERHVVDSSGKETTLLQALAPHPELRTSSRGAFVAETWVDPDGTTRRLRPQPDLERMGLEGLAEHMASVKIERATPIEFPSLERPLPLISYKDALEGNERYTSMIRGKLVFVGSVLDESGDLVGVPRLQTLSGGRQTFQLPGVVVLASITETLLRGAPIQDATWPLALAWNVLWCVIAVTLMPRRRPVAAAVILVAVLAAAVAATGALHIGAGVVMPGGLLLGSLVVVGAHALLTSYIETTKLLYIEEAENERVRMELETARRTQEGFLPKKIPVLDGYDVWGVNVSSLEVSGDYFDLVDLGDSRPLVVAIADVSGKGLPASLLMSNVQAGLHSHLYQDEFDLASALRNLNRLVCENSAEGAFVTMFVGELLKESRVLRYVRAGHDLPVVVSADGRVRKLQAGGVILGAVPGVDYEISELRLEKDDVVCLYTDGVTEARNKNKEEFGLERLTDLLKGSRESDSQSIGQAIVRSVSEFSGLKTQADDVTTVIIKTTK
jgi:serine phosphatase RsbU (regulator of sigma subunit)/CHASE2 domain-containing sensor protein